MSHACRRHVRSLQQCTRTHTARCHSNRALLHDLTLVHGRDTSAAGLRLLTQDAIVDSADCLRNLGPAIASSLMETEPGDDSYAWRVRATGKPWISLAAERTLCIQSTACCRAGQMQLLAYAVPQLAARGSSGLYSGSPNATSPARAVPGPLPCRIHRASAPLTKSRRHLCSRSTRHSARSVASLPRHCLE